MINNKGREKTRSAVNTGSGSFRVLACIAGKLFQSSQAKAGVYAACLLAHSIEKGLIGLFAVALFDRFVRNLDRSVQGTLRLCAFENQITE